MTSNIFVCLILSLVVQLSAAGVIELTKDTFDQHVDGSSNILVEFYAPWCGHCKNLAPEWKVAAETFLASDPIKMAALDATTAPDIASKYGVQGYPTIKFFKEGSTTPEDYNGGRSADTIVEWVNDKVGTSRVVKAAPSAVATLHSANFDASVESKASLVEFYAPWCGHCKQLAPVYESLAEAFAPEDKVLIAKVDATKDGDIADKFGVQGYPTLKWFPAGSLEAEDFNGGRDLESLVDFVNSKAGTDRNSDGSLKESAGRLAALDELITNHVANGGSIDSSLSDSLTAAVNALTDTEEITKGAAYLSHLTKAISKGGAEYFKKEISRLATMIANPNVASANKGKFQLKQNVLRAFAV